MGTELQHGDRKGRYHQKDKKPLLFSLHSMTTMTVLAFVGGREQEFQGCKNNWGAKEGPRCKMSLFETQISLSGEGFPTEQKLYFQCLSKLGLLGHSL